MAPLVAFLVIVASWLMAADQLLEFYNRTFDPSRLLTGREFIWGNMLEDLWSYGAVDFVFGSDFVRKSVWIPEIGYLTPDAHNLFFEYIRYYGITSLLYFYLGFRFCTKSIIREKQRLLYGLTFAFFAMAMFSGIIRFTYLPILIVFMICLIIITAIEHKSRGKT